MCTGGIDINPHPDGKGHKNENQNRKAFNSTISYSMFKKWLIDDVITSRGSLYDLLKKNVSVHK
jgi:hypothetical protein